MMRKIHPIPYDPALEGRILFDQLPVICEVADAVSHGVGVFAQDERSLGI